MAIIISKTSTLGAKVDRRGRKVLDNTLLSAGSSNPLTQPSEIEMTIDAANLPQYGTMLRNGAPVTSTTVLTIADLSSLTYRHESDYHAPPFDYLTLKLRDKSHPGSPVVDAKITFTIVFSYYPPLPDAPLVPANTKVGGTVDILRANISYNDVNSWNKPADIYFELVSLPTQGYLYKNGVKITDTSTLIQFTQRDIDENRIKYVHDETKANPSKPFDTFVFKTRDSSTAPNNPGNLPGVNTEFRINIAYPNLPFDVAINGPLRVDQGAQGTIDGTLLKVVDPDTEPVNIVFTITSLPDPSKGKLKIKNANGTTTDVAINRTFTQVDIDSGILFYEHNGSETTEDSFNYRVTDGLTVENKTFPIIIRLIPNLPPVVVTRPMTVPQGEAEAADDRFVTITDPEEKPLSELVVTFSKLPVNGWLMYKGEKVTAENLSTFEFKASDFGAGNLVYKHDNSTNLTDSIGFDVSDGKNSTGGNIPITIIRRTTYPPELITNSGLDVPRGGKGIVDKRVITFTDRDTPPANVTIKILSLPTKGTLKEGATDITVGKTYTLTAWANIVLDYQHTQTNDEWDAFTFELDDPDHDPVGPFTFEIRIQAPPPNVPPTLINNGMDVVKLGTGNIGETNLFATDPDNGPEELVFTINTKPTKGRLFIDGVEVTDEPNSPRTFTVKDISALKISYTNTDATATTDNFTFTLSDGTNTIDGTFVIRILQGLILDVNNQLLVDQGETKGIGPNLLHAYNRQIPETEKIVYTVTTPPAYGTLLLNGEPTSSFTQKDIDDGLLSYEHSNSTASQSDKFNFDVTDGFETLRNRIFNIKIVLAPVPPEIVRHSMTTVELTCKDLNGDHLWVRDSTSDVLIVYQILPNEDGDTVKFGELKKNGVKLNPGDSFTQADILAGRISYCNTALSPTDAFLFTVNNGKAGIESTSFDITIVPPRDPELISTGSTMPTCSTVAITPASLRVDFLPTSVQPIQLVYRVSRAPGLLGVLLLNGEPLSANSTFTQKDINDGALSFQHFGLNPETLSFDFDWFVEGEHLTSRDLFGSGTYNITVTYTNNPPWLCLLNGLVVDELTTGVIDSDHLYMCDVDLDADGGLNLPPDLGTLDWNTRGGAGGFTDTFSVTKGASYEVTMNAKNGKMSIVLSTVSGEVIDKSNCFPGTITNVFVIPDIHQEVRVSVVPGCDPANKSTSWTLKITKRP